MTDKNLWDDEHQSYAEQFNPLRTDRQARRKRKLRPGHHPKKTAKQVIAEIAAATTIEEEFTTTYKPSKHETGWLLSSLKPFYDQALITDVLALIKGGKEANVYRCRANPSLDVEFLAAKVYRPRMFRQIRNDALYRQGRQTLTAEGKAAENTDQRILHAVAKKTAFGVQAAHTSWLMHEYTTLQRLHGLGAAVPQPFGTGENAILMTYWGDENTAAPTLNTVELAPEEAESLFAEVLRNIDLMLQQGLIHGDLSAYNLLYWEGQITMIDFPQVVNLHTNDDAYFILQRDITRICAYFVAQGVECETTALLDDLWGYYVGISPDEQTAERANFLPEPEEEEDDYDEDDYDE